MLQAQSPKAARVSWATSAGRVCSHGDGEGPRKVLFPAQGAPSSFLLYPKQRLWTHLGAPVLQPMRRRELRRVSVGLLLLLDQTGLLFPSEGLLPQPGAAGTGDSFAAPPAERCGLAGHGSTCELGCSREWTGSGQTHLETRACSICREFAPQKR